MIKKRKARINVVKQFGNLISTYKEIVKSKGQECKKYFIVLRIVQFENANEYEIKIVLSQNAYPKIYIVSPNIFNDSCGKKPPHVYEYNKEKCRICLFLPGEVKLFEYYDKIVPWISEWLLNYEIWKITGVWNGGGHSGEKR